MTITTDQVVEAYTKTRDEITRLEKELEAKLAPMKEVQNRREQYLLKLIMDLGAQNIKTPHGTAFLAKKESVRIADWDKFVDFVIMDPIINALTQLLGRVLTKSGEELIKSTIKIEFLNKAANKTSVLESMGDERTELPPPGVDYTAIRTVQVRKS